jgi:2-methylcitrate dehydratase PrpD
MFVHNDVGDEAASTFGLQEPLQLRQLKFKPYCCCAATHGYIEIMETLRGRADDIEAVDTNIQTMSDAIVGNRNAHIYKPRNIEELQYSLPMQMALAALGMGNGYKTHRAYLDGKLSLAPDSAPGRLASRIKLHVSKDLDQRYPRTFVAEVNVRYRDGSTQHIFLDRIKGTPNKPFTRPEHRAKLDELCEDVIGLSKAAEVFDIVDTLDPAQPIRNLTRLLRW